MDLAYLAKLAPLPSDLELSGLLSGYPLDEEKLEMEIEVGGVMVSLVLCPADEHERVLGISAPSDARITINGYMLYYGINGFFTVQIRIHGQEVLPLEIQIGAGKETVWVGPLGFSR